LAKLKPNKRDFNAILELWTPPEGDLVSIIAKEERWAIESVRYLRKYIHQ